MGNHVRYRTGNSSFLSTAATAAAMWLLIAAMVFFTGCADRMDTQTERETMSAEPAGPTEPALEPPSDEPAEPAEPEPTDPSTESSDEDSTQTERPKVYFTKDISPEGLMAAYNALGRQPHGNVAVKLSTGEPGSNYLRPALIENLVKHVNGTIVESNTAYPGGKRGTTAMHRQLAKDHGFTDIATVDILDENGSDSLTVAGGTILSKNYVGSHFKNYDYYVVLSHFKGHIMAGLGGAIKNISIGIASTQGKCWIHTAGKSRTSFSGGDQDEFLKSMAEAGKSVVDHLNGNILYINVMNRLSIECDCFANPVAPDMHDIGILSSLDPVALDQACVDLVKASPKTPTSSNVNLIKRMEEKNGYLAIDHGERIGLGSKSYELVDLDNTTGIRHEPRNGR